MFCDADLQYLIADNSDEDSENSKSAPKPVRKLLNTQRLMPDECKQAGRGSRLGACGFVCRALPQADAVHCCMCVHSQAQTSGARGERREKCRQQAQRCREA
jgi:hypothetical protein